MNRYYFSKEHKLFTLIHKDKPYNPFPPDAKTESFEDELSNHFNAQRIKLEFVNSYGIVFEVTSACNLKCKYCTYGEFYCHNCNRKTRNLSFQMATKLIDYYLELRNSSFYYNSYDAPFTIGFYGGEPLLNFNLISKIVQYVEGKIPNVSYNMTTNATLMTKHIDFLKENNFSLLISLDGDEENNSYRVYPNENSSFNTVYRSVNLLKEKYPFYFNEKVSFNTVLHNKNSVGEIYRFFKKEFNKTPRISELSPSGLSIIKKKDFLQVYRNLLQSYLEEDCSQLVNELRYDNPEINDLTNFLFKFSGNLFNNYNDLFIEQNQVKLMPTGTCAPFNRKIFLLVDGRILPCERIGQELEYGKVTNKKVELDFSYIAEQQNKYYDKMKKSCLSCGHLKYCQKCLLQLDNIKSIPFCRNFTADKQIFQNYIKSQMSKLENKSHLYEYIWNNITLE